MRGGGLQQVEFNENNAGGSSTVVGQFVGPEMTKVGGWATGGAGVISKTLESTGWPVRVCGVQAYSSGGRGRRRFYARDSRETTINNGRRRIQQVRGCLDMVHGNDSRRACS